jgi:hypothetical protein
MVRHCANFWQHLRLSSLPTLLPDTTVIMAVTAQADEAHKRRIPVEVVLQRFLEWQLGRPVKAKLYTNSVKKKAKR